jgi:hypothetical protein
MTQWKLVPVTPDQSMCQAGQWKANEWKRFPLRIGDIWQAMLNAAPAPDVQPVAWTEREIELIDEMIEVQLIHSERLDRIPNRAMADKQKGWNMERVALLQKIKAAPPATSAQPVAWIENLTDPRPDAVTDLKYCSVAQHDRGDHLKYVPLFMHPPATDVQELLEALQSLLECHEVLSPIEGDETRKARKALAKWEGK